MIDRYLEQTSFSSYEDFMQNFRVKVPENFNFGYDVVDVYAKEQPEKKAILWCNDEGKTVTVTYAQYKEMSDRVASMLLELGIRKGDCVMLILRRRLEWWISMIALHKIGAIAIPASQLLTTKDIIYRCQAADIKAIIALGEEPIIGHIAKAKSDCPSLEYMISVGPNVPEGWVDYHKAVEAAPEFHRLHNTTMEDNMLLYFTSGTSGQPKMVVHSYDYPLCHFLTAQWQNLDNTGLHLTLSDTSWAMAIWGSFYPQMLAGACICVYDVVGKFDPKKLLRLMEKHHVTSFFAAPTVYRFMMHEKMEDYDLSSLRYCNIAGEAMYPAFYAEWKKRTGISLMECYGQTESALIIGTMPWCEPHPGSMGVANPQYEVKVLDNEGNECPCGKPGNLVINCKNGHPLGLLRGYYRGPELTKKVFRNGVYYTGDMVYRDEDGYFWFESRADDVIKSSGYRIGPFEVESALMTHPAVAECAITGVPDEIRGQIVKATIVLNQGFRDKANDELKKELQKHVKETTAPYKYPRVIDFVDELPKTINGKLRRVEIREKDEAGK